MTDTGLTAATNAWISQPAAPPIVAPLATTSPAPSTGVPMESPGREVHLSDLDQDGPDASVVWGLFREAVDPYVVAHMSIDGEPVSKARARFTNYRSPGHAYTPEKTRTAEDMVAWHFRKARPDWHLSKDGSFGVIAVFFCGTFQRRDVDNMLKLVLDACNKVVWLDDAQVTEVSGRVLRGVPDARTEIAIYRTWGSGRPEQVCVHCGTRFPAYKSTTAQGKKYCSQDCRLAYQRNQRLKQCAHCGNDFFPKPSQDAQYCSRPCADTARRVDVQCAHCGTTFSKPQSLARAGNSYCDDECRNAYWRAHRTKNAQGTCTICGGTTSKKDYKRCNACKRAGLVSP